MKLTRAIQNNWSGLLVLGLALIAWELLAQRDRSFFFPPISTVFSTFYEVWFSPRFLEHAIPSLGRMFAGYLLAAALGIVLGMLTGSIESLYKTLEPFLEFMRALPHALLIPIGILFLGIGDTMKVVLIISSVVWPILLNSTEGARNVSQERLDTAANFGLGRLEVIRRVVFPSALPMIFAGLRIGLAFAFIMVVVSEMIGSTNGIGYYILNAQRTFAVPDMFAGILLLALLGFGFNSLFLWFESKVLFWHRGETGQLEG